jgi:protein involved in polysaccharide export with SLBB domain
MSSQRDTSTPWGATGSRRRTPLGRSLLLAGWVCTLVHSCGPGVDPAYRRAVANTEGTFFRPDELGPTDRIELRVAGEPDLSGEFTVSSDGTISYPWLGALFVDGLTCREVAAAIRDGLADGYLRDPGVSCQITAINSRKIDIIGEVARPGSFVFENNMTILRAIALAQGFTDDAAPNETAVLRVVDGVETRIRVPVEDIIDGDELNFPLAPGDTIVVPRYRLLP